MFLDDFKRSVENILLQSGLAVAAAAPAVATPSFVDVASTPAPAPVPTIQPNHLLAAVDMERGTDESSSCPAHNYSSMVVIRVLVGGIGAGEFGIGGVIQRMQRAIDADAWGTDVTAIRIHPQVINVSTGGGAGGAGGGGGGGAGQARVLTLLFWGCELPRNVDWAGYRDTINRYNLTARTCFFCFFICAETLLCWCFAVLPLISVLLWVVVLYNKNKNTRTQRIAWSHLCMPIACSFHRVSFTSTE